MSVESTIQGMFDRIAKIRQDMGVVASGGTDFWSRADAAADETFENRVKGTDATDADAALLAQSVWGNSKLSKLIKNIRDYCRLDLGLASPYLTTYIQSKGWRVPYETGQAIVEALGSSSRLPAQWVFPKGTKPADTTDPTNSGMHQFCTFTGTSTDPISTVVDGALSSYVKGAAILAINTTAGVTTTGLVIRVTLQDGTTKDISYDHTQAVQYTQGIVGVGAVGIGGAIEAQPDVLVKNAVTQFKAGEWILLAKNDFSLTETVQIDSIDTLTLTMKTNLVHTWAEDDLVIPLFTNAEWGDSGTISEGDIIKLYAMPDRIIAL